MNQWRIPVNMVWEVEVMACFACKRGMLTDERELCFSGPCHNAAHCMKALRPGFEVAIYGLCLARKRIGVEVGNVIPCGWLLFEM